MGGGQLAVGFDWLLNSRMAALTLTVIVSMVAKQQIGCTHLNCYCKHTGLTKLYHP